MQRIRTFVAVTASPEVKQSARKVAALLGPACRDVRWVDPETMHWTLQFLGDIETLEIPAVCSAVSQAAIELEAFELDVYGVGAFPGPDRPRTLWLGAGAGAQCMLTLQAAIQKKLDRLGYRGESRRYVPHLTIGKARGDASSRSLVRELAGLADFQAGKMFVDEVMVFSSELRPEGPIYDVLARAPLAT